METAILAIGLILMAGYVLEYVYERYRIPDVFILILIGVVLGPVLHTVRPEDFGKVNFVVAKIALVLLLFREGLELHWDELRKTLRKASLAGLTIFSLSAVISALGARWMLELPWMESWILGSMLGAASPAVVIPMLKGLRISRNLVHAVVIEATIADVLAIVITLALLTTYEIGTMQVSRFFGALFSSFAMGGLIGFAGGIVWMILSRRFLVFPTTTLSLVAYVFLVYGIAEVFHWSGAVAALVFGMTLGNSHAIVERIHRLMDGVHIQPFEVDEIRERILSEMIFFIKVFFFVLLGISMNVLDAGGLLYALGVSLLFFPIRLLGVRMFFGTSFSREEQAIASCLIPRGVIPAVLSLYFARFSEEYGSILVASAYAVILVSILLSAILILLVELAPVKKWLVWSQSHLPVWRDEEAEKVNGETPPPSSS